MSGYPSPGVAVLQGLLAALLLMGPLMAYVFGSRFRVSLVDMSLALTAYGGLAIGTIALFLPFEGDWVIPVLGPLEDYRSLLVGGLVLAIGMAVVQWRTLVQRGTEEALTRLGAVFLLGALWGTVWGFAGWCLYMIGMANNG